MATENSIDAKDMPKWEKDSIDPNKPADERAMLAVMLVWAKSETPNGGDWIYSWE
jgi:hypothetical protein